MLEVLAASHTTKELFQLIHNATHSPLCDAWVRMRALVRQGRARVLGDTRGVSVLCRIDTEHIVRYILEGAYNCYEGNSTQWCSSCRRWYMGWANSKMCDKCDTPLKDRVRKLQEAEAARAEAEGKAEATEGTCTPRVQRVVGFNQTVVWCPEKRKYAYK